MKYIVLLRGINISGKNKISMAELKELLENNNYENVKTFLNSGNVIIDSKSNKDKIREDVHKLILENFDLDIPVYVISSIDLNDMLNHSPEWWVTENKNIYDNIIFIMHDSNYEEIYSVVGEPKENIDTIEKYNNIIFWSYDLSNYRKSTWWIKTASTNIKDKITIRTANTVKKLLELCEKE